MNVLLDTHALIWAMGEADRRGPAASGALLDPKVTPLGSHVSLWEIAIKQGAGRLRLHLPLFELVARLRAEFGAKEAGIRVAQPEILRTLPNHHLDPFDKLLVCQAIDLGVPLVSHDPALDAYPIQRIW